MSSRKLEQDLAATIRFQRLFERLLELVERVHMLHCGGEPPISHEVSQLLVNLFYLCPGRAAYPIDEPESVEAKTTVDEVSGRDGWELQDLLALSAEGIEWIIPGEDWPLAGTHRWHAGLNNLLQKANETLETSYPEPPEFIAQGDPVLVVGFARGRIKATNRTFEDHWVFAITIRNGKVTNIREYVDTQALARASETAASPRP
jgi:uncharacterized protein